MPDPFQPEGAAASNIPRTTDTALQVVQLAMDAVVEDGIVAARKVLQSSGMVPTHLVMDCPLMHLKHFDLNCLPADRLHLA